MRRALLLALAFVGIVCKPSVAQRDGGWQRVAKQYGWRLDYEASKAEARQNGKPLMVVLRCVP